MKTTAFLFGVAVLVIGLFLFTGCDNDNDDVMSNSDSGIVSVAAVYPADGVTNVSTSAAVAIKFTGPVDTMSVMENLHLAGGQAMHEWRDSVSHHGGFGMMHMNMEDHMMDWMDSIHTPGDFHWNSTRDSCEFVADSALMANTEYLCLLFEGGMHDSHGGMMGDANHNDNGYHIYGFTTGP